MAQGDTAPISVYLNTNGATINVVDGSITLPGNAVFTMRDIDLAGSALTLWPRTPSLSADGKTLTFVGGVPHGISTSHGLLFTLYVTARTHGAATIAPSKTLAYLNDGQGTALSVTGRPLALVVHPAVAGVPPHDAWQALIAQDSTPPAPFTILPGQDPSLFAGQQYLFFQTSDNGSGVDHYEVAEGAAAPVRSGTTYVLQHQNTPETITVYAYNKAGLAQTSTYQIGGSSNTAWTVGAWALLLLILAVGVCYLRRRARRTRITHTI